MYSPVHAATGLLLAQLAPEPVSAFLLGAGSHYVLDHLPHGDTGVGPWIAVNPGQRLPRIEIIDLGLAALLVWWLASHIGAPPPLTLLAGAIGGIAPDLVSGAGQHIIPHIRWIPQWIHRFLGRHQRWHEWIHVQGDHDVPFLAGLLAQIVIVVGLALLYV